MTEKTELCGFQPTGRSEDVPKPPKYNLNAEFWRTQWSEASGAHLMEYLRAEKLQEQLNTAKKALTEIGSGTWHSRDRGLVVDTSDGETVSLFTLTDQALAAIGGDDE